MNLWVIHQTENGTKKWKLEPRKEPWVLGTSRQSALRIQSPENQAELYGAFDYHDKNWVFTRLTPPDPNSNVQRSIKIEESTEIKFDKIHLRVVPLKDKASLLGLHNTATGTDTSLLKKVIKELTKFKSSHFFDKETGPFLGAAAGGCFLLLLFLVVAPKPSPKIAQNPNETRTIEIKTDFMMKPKALAQAMKNSVAPKQMGAPATAGSVKNSKQVIGAIFSKIQGRALQKVVKNVTLTATSKNVVSGVLSNSLSKYSNAIPDAKQMAAIGSGAGNGMGKVGINTVGSGGTGGGVAGYGQMDHGEVGKAKIGLLSEESDVTGGLDREVIAAYIQSKLGPILYCYERQLSANPSLYGKVAVKFSIKADGIVDHSEISETTLRCQSVETCLLSQVNKWQFPKPKGGMKVVVTYPFMFKSIN